MKIHKLNIKGFKSISNLELDEPNPFSVFVGPNAAGKSNIFEAIEFFELCNMSVPNKVMEAYNKTEDIFNQSIQGTKELAFSVDLGKDEVNENLQPQLLVKLNQDLDIVSEYKSYGRILYPSFSDLLYFNTQEKNSHFNSSQYNHFTNFSKLFVGNNRVRNLINNDSKLSPDASNLEQVLKRILKDVLVKEEIIEILQLLIPGFSKLEVRTEELSGKDSLIVYEDSLSKPLTKHLISDGTYNIIALITAIFQSDKPQFLCIEEPENGLNPKVIRHMVSLFRNRCLEKGDYIWLNSHSQSLVSELTPDELILVNKIDGNTVVKQLKGFNLNGMKMDDALLTNSLGGGIPW